VVGAVRVLKEGHACPQGWRQTRIRCAMRVAHAARNTHSTVYAGFSPQIDSDTGRDKRVPAGLAPNPHPTGSAQGINATPHVKQAGLPCKEVDSEPRI
jgi:hypothetical protein